MRTALLSILAVGALTVAGCDAPGAPAAEKPAAAPAAAKSASVPKPAAAEPPPTATMGLTEPYKTQADWVKACSTATPPVPESVCTCVAKAAVKETSEEVLYNWLYEYFVNRDGFARSRAERWFTSKGMDKEKMQKVADVTGKCFVTQ